MRLITLIPYLMHQKNPITFTILLNCKVPENWPHEGRIEFRNLWIEYKEVDNE